jgi:hypothetical protein
MPITQFRDAAGASRSFDDEMLASLRGESTVGLPVLAAIVQGLRANDRPSASAGFSATQFLTCSRKIVLEASFDVSDLPANQYWASRGQTAHRIIEDALAALPAYIRPLFSHEERLYAELPVSYHGESYSIGIHGRYDLLYVPPYPNQVFDDPRLGDLPGSPILFDHKNTSFAPKKEAKIEHIAQLSIYAWLLFRVRHLVVPAGRINYMDNKRTIEHAVRLWNYENTTQYIEERLSRLLPAYVDGELPERVGPWGQWQCGANRDKKSYCPFSDQCWPDGVGTEPDGFTDPETGMTITVLPLRERT